MKKPFRKKCIICGKEFKPYNSRYVNCSRKCSREYQKAYQKAYQKTDKYKAYQKAYQKAYYEKKKVR